MRVALKVEQDIPQVPAAMGKDVGLRELGLQLAGQEIDGQRETVHLGEQGDNKCRKGTQRTPVETCFRFGEAEGKK